MNSSFDAFCLGKDCMIDWTISELELPIKCSALWFRATPEDLEYIVAMAG